MSVEEEVGVDDLWWERVVMEERFKESGRMLEGSMSPLISSEGGGVLVSRVQQVFFGYLDEPDENLRLEECANGLVGEGVPPKMVFWLD